MRLFYGINVAEVNGDLRHGRFLGCHRGLFLVRIEV